MSSKQKVAEAVLGELCRADVHMNPRERALGDELLDLVADVDTVAEMLGALSKADPAVALALAPLIDLLRSAGDRAVGVHAAVVANLLRPAVH